MTAIVRRSLLTLVVVVVVVVKVTVVIVGAVAAAKSRALARGGSPQMVPRLRSTRTLWAFPEFRTDIFFCFSRFACLCSLASLSIFDSLFFRKIFHAVDSRTRSIVRDHGAGDTDEDTALRVTSSLPRATWFVCAPRTRPLILPKSTNFSASSSQSQPMRRPLLLLLLLNLLIFYYFFLLLLVGPCHSRSLRII